jgi:hypothetical protein
VLLRTHIQNSKIWHIHFSFQILLFKHWYTCSYMVWLTVLKWSCELYCPFGHQHIVSKAKQYDHFGHAKVCSTRHLCIKIWPIIEKSLQDLLILLPLRNLEYHGHALRFGQGMTICSYQDPYPLHSDRVK